MTPRTIAIGDIHGCHRALEQLLRDVKPGKDDTVIVLGDVVDRGPGTKQAIDQLLAIEKNCELIYLMGNHEEMMLEARGGSMIETTWLRYGGQETLNSYGGGYGMVPDHHWEFLQSGRDFLETETEIFVHASLEPDVPLEEQSSDWLRWSRLTGEEEPRECGRRVICGHTSLPEETPWVFPGWVCLDTRCYANQVLTALDVTNNLVYQARQTGESIDPFPLPAADDETKSEA